MKLLASLCLLAMTPAALNVAPAQAQSLTMPLCSGDGVVRTVTVPVGPSQLPGHEPPGCCVKGCHSGSSRKRSQRPG